jgi:4-aminobutyrate aminotransferase-like enzyme
MRLTRINAMNALPSNPVACADHQAAIDALSDQFHVPAHQVGAVFSEQLGQLAAQARIQTYLVVLALRNTRSILRRSH